MKYATGRAARVAAFVLRDREMAESMEHLSIPIKWDEVANAPTLFANHLLVQEDQHEFYLCFVDIAPPLLEGETDRERLEALHKVECVKARPVARIGIAAERLENIVTTLRDSLEKYRATQRAMRPSQEHSSGQEMSEPDKGEDKPKSVR